MLSLFILSTTGSNVYAQAPSDVQQAAKQSLVQFTHSLNVNRENFGLTTTDDSAVAALEEGYPYYKISVAALKDHESGKKVDSSQLYTPSGGYIFPINIGKKAIGIAFVEYFEGKWQVVQISSDTNFENDVASAKAKIKKTLPQENLSSDMELIYDLSFGVSALQVRSSKGEYIMPLKDNNSLKLKQNELKPHKDNLDKLDALYKERTPNDQHYGGTAAISTQTKPTSWGWPIAVLILCLAGGGLILIRRWLTHKPTC
jgi:hypothetical protein